MAGRWDLIGGFQGTGSPAGEGRESGKSAAFLRTADAARGVPTYDAAIMGKPMNRRNGGGWRNATRAWRKGS